VTTIADAVPAVAHTGASAAARETPLSRFPPRPAAARWPVTEQDRVQALRLVAAASSALSSSRIGDNFRRGVPLLLDWLEEHPGRSWQERWLSSGADAAGDDWAHGPASWLKRVGKYSPSRLELLTSSLLVAVGADIVRPSLTWLLTGGKKRKLARNMIRSRDPEGFETLRRLCQDDPGVTVHAQRRILFRAAVIISAKGGMLADITVGDVLEVLDAEISLRRRADCGEATCRVLREMGVFGAAVPTLREIRSTGQRTVEELVNRYPIVCRPIRDLLVDYLKERQPAIDYTTLVGHSYNLARCFWLDLEQHHPGIESLRLPTDVAAAWKQRLRTRNKTIKDCDGDRIDVEVERLSYLDTLAAVRAFYLDLAQWALEEPARWGPWVAPCPISQQDLTRRKHTRRRKARMDARTRERLPVLPILVRTTDQRRKEAQAGR
jgi:hypothetical protein